MTTVQRRTSPFRGKDGRWVCPEALAARSRKLKSLLCGGLESSSRRGMPSSYPCFTRWASIALMALLALSSTSSFAGMRPEEVKEFEAYKVKAEKGDPVSQQGLGWCYRFGSGVAKDEAEGIKWWRKAADQGNATAQLNLGSEYQKGEFVAWSGFEAMRLWRSAAEQGLAAAQNILGQSYESGSGVAKDEIEAYAFYSLAGMTLEFSRNNLSSLAEKMTPGAISRGKQRAAELQKEIEAKIASKKGAPRRDKTDYLEPPSIDSSNPDGAAERFLERMRQKHGEVSDIDGKKFIFIDNGFPLCRTFRKGYYRIDNISLTDKLEMLAIVIQMQKHLEKLDDILKGPNDEESIKRGMLRMNQWADDGRNLEGRLHSILGVK